MFEAELATGNSVETAARASTSRAQHSRLPEYESQAATAVPGGIGVFVATGINHRPHDSQSRLAVSQSIMDSRDLYPFLRRGFDQTVSEARSEMSVHLHATLPLTARTGHTMAGASLGNHPLVERRVPSQNRVGPFKTLP